MKYPRYIVHALRIWAKGIRWLWTRRIWTIEGETPLGDGEIWQWGETDDPPPGEEIANWGIEYKPGWGPWKFLPVYLTTYLAGIIAGYGCISLSRAWYERREVSRLALIMTRLLNWVFPGYHGRSTGPRLWGLGGVR